MQSSNLRTHIATALFMAVTILCSRTAFGQEPAKQSSPLKVLLVAGGCCHDYASQTKLLKAGIEQRINSVVTIVLSENKTTKAVFDIYKSDDWAKGYDIVIHDECSADVTEQPYVDRILKVHQSGTPAVNLHCAMHSYRWGEFRQPVELSADNAKWYEMIGIAVYYIDWRFGTVRGRLHSNHLIPFRVVGT